MQAAGIAMAAWMASRRAAAVVPAASRTSGAWWYGGLPIRASWPDLEVAAVVVARQADFDVAQRLVRRQWWYPALAAMVPILTEDLAARRRTAAMGSDGGGSERC